MNLGEYNSNAKWLYYEFLVLFHRDQESGVRVKPGTFCPHYEKASINIDYSLNYEKIYDIFLSETAIIDETTDEVLDIIQYEIEQQVRMQVEQQAQK